MCLGVYLTPNRTHITSTICVHKKDSFVYKASIDPGCYESFNI